jgi:hypothetical protein
LNPGDTLEGSGLLLQHGRLVARVDYHLAVPRASHFTLNPGSLHLDYESHLSGFILVSPAAAEDLELAVYTLELADKSKRPIRIERRYKKIKHKGETRISFWVTVLQT